MPGIYSGGQKCVKFPISCTRKNSSRCSHTRSNMTSTSQQSFVFFLFFFFYVPLPEYDLWLDGGSVEIIHESEVNLSLQSCEQCIRLQVAKQRLGSYLQFYFFTFTDQTWYAK